MTFMQKEKLTELFRELFTEISENKIGIEEAVDIFIDNGVELNSYLEEDSWFKVIKKDICDESESDECYCCIEKGTLANSRCIHHKVEICIEQISPEAVEETEIGKTIFSTRDKALRKLKEMIKRSKRAFTKENI